MGRIKEWLMNYTISIAFAVSILFWTVVFINVCGE